MGAPTNTAYAKKVLANPQPSTHGGKADVPGALLNDAIDLGCVKTRRSI